MNMAIRVKAMISVAALLIAGGWIPALDLKADQTHGTATRHRPRPNRVVTTGVQDPPAPAPIPTPPLALVGPVELPEHKLARWSLTGGKANCAWLIQPFELVDLEQNGQAVTFTGPPGKYQIICSAVVGVQPAFYTAICTITPTTAPVPPPTPTPVPPVPPEPAPSPVPIVSGKLWALAVFDTATVLNLPPPQRELRVSPTIIASMNALDTVWRVYEPVAKVLAAPARQDALKATGLPGFMIIDTTGKIVESMPLPPDEPTTVAVVSKLRGK